MADEWQPPEENQFNKEWLTPRRARELLAPLHSGQTGKRFIMGRLKSGYIEAVARQCEWQGNLTSLVPVPRACWQAMTDYGDDYFWETGDASFTHKNSLARLFDVRFNTLFADKPQGLEQPQFPESEAVRPNASQVNTGGAPRKAWWDDLWIEMIRRIRADELHPETAAELQRIMLDWLGEQGFYPGEDTLKKTARKLFKYLQE